MAEQSRGPSLDQVRRLLRERAVRDARDLRAARRETGRDDLAARAEHRPELTVVERAADV